MRSVLLLGSGEKTVCAAWATALLDASKKRVCLATSVRGFLRGVGQTDCPSDVCTRQYNKKKHRWAGRGCIVSNAAAALIRRGAGQLQHDVVLCSGLIIVFKKT